LNIFHFSGKKNHDYLEEEYVDLDWQEDETEKTTLRQEKPTSTSKPIIKRKVDSIDEEGSGEHHQEDDDEDEAKSSSSLLEENNLESSGDFGKR
jgi:hypothetical protein